MTDFVGNILQSKFYACCYILLSVAILMVGLGGPWPPQFFHNFPFKFILLTYPVDDVRLAMF